MFKAALRSLMGRKLRLLMSTFAIVLGVGFVVGTLIFSDTLNRSFTAIFASSVGDVVVRPTGGPAGDGSPSTVTIDADLADRLGEVEGAARVDGNVEALGVFVIDEDGKPIGGLGPPALAGNWTDAPAANGITGLVITDGEAPQGADEVVLDEATAEKAGYRLGDRVELITTFQQVELQPTLVGIAGFGEGGSLNGATLAIFETRAAQELFLGGDEAFNSFWVTAEDGTTQEELRDRVQEVLPTGVEAVTGDAAADEAASDLLTAISFITTFLLIFAVIALVVGSFLIVNTFSILVAQRSRELALLRALGASRGQVKRMVLVEATALGLLGSTLGLVLGLGLFWVIRAAFGEFGLDLSGTPMVFEPRTVLAAYAVGVVVTVLAAWIPARRTSKIAPVAAMRDDVALPETTLRRRFALGTLLIVAGAGGIALALFGDDVWRAGYVLGGGTLAVLLGVAAASPVLARPYLDATSRGFSRAFGSVGRLAGQNSRRNPRRTAATASALMIGLTLCVTMAILGSSAKASVDDAVRKNFVGDFVISNVFGGAFSATLTDQVEQVEGVASVNRIRFQFAESDGDSAFLQAVEPAEVESGLRVDVLDGDLQALTGESTVMVSEGEAEDRGLEVGDVAPITVPTGEQDYEVVAVFADNPLLDGFVMSLDSFAAAGYQQTDNFAFIEVAAGADREAVRAELEELTDTFKLVSVKDQDGLAEEQRGPIDQLLLLIYGLLALALVIAVLGIVNTLALSVIERTREIGLLRAIGLSRRQLRSMIRLESVVISVLGALLGTAVGLAFGVVLMHYLREEGLEVIAVPWGQLAAFLVVSVLVGVLAAVFPARRAARLDVLRAIATE